MTFCSHHAHAVALWSPAHRRKRTDDAQGLGNLLPTVRSSKSPPGPLRDDVLPPPQARRHADKNRETVIGAEIAQRRTRSHSGLRCAQQLGRRDRASGTQGPGNLLSTALTGRSPLKGSTDDVLLPLRAPVHACARSRVLAPGACRGMGGVDRVLRIGPRGGHQMETRAGVRSPDGLHSHPRERRRSAGTGGRR